MTRRTTVQTSATVFCAVDVVCLTVVRARLAVLLTSTDNGFRLPGATWRPGVALETVAAAVYDAATARTAKWCEQVGAHVHGDHPTGSALSVTFVAGVSPDAPTLPGTTWRSVRRLGGITYARQRLAVSNAVRHLRARAEFASVAFSVLPERFTLGELQVAYELLVGQPVFVATFRRWLRRGALVVPSGEMRSDRRGRPARLYRRARLANSAEGLAGLRRR
jgi:8-oxo-dGTP diphosphatase